MTTGTELMMKCEPTIGEVIDAKTRRARYEAIGWCHAFCCAALDDGLDPRTIEVPAILEKAKAQLETPNSASKLRPTGLIKGAEVAPSN